MTAAMEEMDQSAMFLNVTDHLHQHAHHLVRVDMTAAMEEMDQSAMFLNVKRLQQHRNQPLKSQDMFINPPPTHVVSLWEIAEKHQLSNLEMLGDSLGRNLLLKVRKKEDSELWMNGSNEENNRIRISASYIQHCLSQSLSGASTFSTNTYFGK